MELNRRRPGFTLVELLVVTVLGAIVMGAIYRTLLMQERTYRHHAAVINVQQTNRLALEVLASELREISPGGGDLTVADQDSIRFRAFRRLGFVCGASAPGQRVDVWEMGMPFSNEDSIIIFADRDTTTAADDTWRASRIQNTDAVNCGTTWAGGLIGGILNPPSDRRLHVPAGDSASIADIRIGAPVRSFQRVTYGLFQFNGYWMLGQRAQNGTLVPYIGPLLGRQEGGLRFRYFDSDGDELTNLPLSTTDRQSVARVEIVVRGFDDRGTAYTDSLATQVTLRNR